MNGVNTSFSNILAKFSIIVKFLESGKIRGRGGEAVLGFLLHEVSLLSKDYAKKLHDIQDVKPYAVSPLLSPESKSALSPSEGVLEIEKEQVARIVLSAFDETTLGVFMKALIDAQKQKRDINIGGIKAEVDKVALRESEGARYITYKDILKKRRIKRSAIFKFLTPLSFRHNGLQLTFPTPEHVFSSLLRTWNAFSDVKIPEEIKEKFSQIGVAQYNLRSELWEFSRYRIFGCRGRIIYNFSKNFSEGEIRILNSLCELANFSGAGYKRTMGMGMVEVRFG